MYRYLLLFTAVILLLFSTTLEAFAGQKIKVVTTLTILEDFVKNVGGDRVEVKSLLTGLESEHTYTPKPSDITSIREAKMLVKIGLGLEIWVDSLIKNASNNNLTIVTTSSGIPLLRNEETDSHGHDAHSGNPHIWLDPERAKVMTRHITDALIKIDPAGRKIYLGNQSEYFNKIDALRKNIEAKLGTVSNRRIITHHPAWPYFAQRFKLQIADNIQTQVGSEPSARHIAGIINLVKKEKIRVIVSEPQLNQKVPRAIAEETGAKLITLTPIPGGLPGTDTYIDMMKHIGEQLATALK